MNTTTWTVAIETTDRRRAIATAQRAITDHTGTEPVYASAYASDLAGGVDREWDEFDGYLIKVGTKK